MKKSNIFILSKIKIKNVFVQSNYEPLNRNNDCIGQWSWYYRGCWHQTCPPLEVQILVILRKNTKGSELLQTHRIPIEYTESPKLIPPKQEIFMTLSFKHTQPLQLVTASVNYIFYFKYE